MNEQKITVKQEKKTSFSTSEIILYKMDIKYATPELMEFMINKIGYRSEDQSEFGGDAYNVDPVDLLDTEINDLENEDIMDTMHNLYGTSDKISIKEIDQFIKDKFDAKKYHLLWVTSNKQDATEYTDEEDPKKALNHVDEWNFKGHCVLPISDLGCEGILVACTE